jgi:hypothetical protein
MGLVIAIAAGLGVMALLWMVLRPRGVIGGGGTTTQISADGFYVQGDFPDGAQVEYEALVNGTWRRGMASVSGTQTFVYTGAAPTEVRILAVIGTGGIVSSAASAILDNSDDDDDAAIIPNAY